MIDVLVLPPMRADLCLAKKGGRIRGLNIQITKMLFCEFGWVHRGQCYVFLSI